MSENNMKHRSSVYDSMVKSPNRAMLRATGMTDDSFEKPIAGVISTWAENTPCNIHLHGFGQIAKEGVKDAGAWPVQFGTITVADGIAMGTPGMRFSLTSRDIINTKMRAILDEATDPWGIKVNRVEVKNIIPPRDIQEAMEKQMRAERERREKILQAEGEKKSAILTAEGEKEAMILRANAKKESMIAEAEGKAKAMERIYEAQARGIEMIKDANPTKEYLSLKSLETYEKMADGKATKIVVPSELQNMASLLTSAKEILVDDAKIDLLKGSIEK